MENLSLARVRWMFLFVPAVEYVFFVSFSVFLSLRRYLLSCSICFKSLVNIQHRYSHSWHVYIIPSYFSVSIGCFCSFNLHSMVLNLFECNLLTERRSETLYFSGIKSPYIFNFLASHYHTKYILVYTALRIFGKLLLLFISLNAP